MSAQVTGEDHGNQSQDQSPIDIGLDRLDEFIKLLRKDLVQLRVRLEPISAEMEERDEKEQSPDPIDRSSPVAHRIFIAANEVESLSAIVHYIINALEV